MDRSVPFLFLESKLKFKTMMLSLISSLEGGMRKTVVWVRKMSLKILSLFVRGKTILSFLCLGTSKMLNLGEFYESKNSLDF